MRIDIQTEHIRIIKDHCPKCDTPLEDIFCPNCGWPQTRRESLGLDGNQAKFERVYRDYIQYIQLQHKAHLAVRRAITSGELIRPDRCQKCGKNHRQLSAHHWSYKIEHWLDVKWLCRYCHSEYHYRGGNSATI